MVYRSVAVPLDEVGKRFSRVTWSAEREREHEVEGYRMQARAGRPPKKRYGNRGRIGKRVA